MLFEEKVCDKCPVETVFHMISGKYKSAILWYLRSGALRYNELQEKIPQASPKMLAEQLKELEKDLLITKNTYPVMPPKTEYRLTPFGEKAIPILQSITEFGREYLFQEKTKT